MTNSLAKTSQRISPTLGGAQRASEQLVLIAGACTWSESKCWTFPLEKGLGGGVVVGGPVKQGYTTGTECTKIARFSAVAAAIFTAPPQNRAISKAPTCAISSAKKIASERRFSLRLKGTNLIPTAEFPAIPESAAKIASERRCAILVHSEQGYK